MSDLELEAALDAMEQLLQGPGLDAPTLLAWQQRFHEALGTAERGPGWPSLVARAHGLATRMDQAIQRLTAEKNALAGELNRSAQGARALKGYRPS